MPTYRHSEVEFIKTWRGLQAGNFISRDLLVNDTDYKYWRANLKDITDEQLLGGLKATKTWGGKAYCMTWSDFNKLCEGSTRSHASYRQFTALPCKPLPGDVIKSRIQTMREELGL